MPNRFMTPDKVRCGKGCFGFSAVSSVRAVAAICMALAVNGCADAPPPGSTAFKQLGATKVTIHQFDPKSEDSTLPALDGWKMVKSLPLDSVLRDRVIRILASADSYADLGAKCFEPGMGFSALNGTGGSIDLVICLECNWAHFIADGKHLDRPALSAKGCRQLAQIFKDAFGYAQPSAFAPGMTVEP